MFNLRLCNFSEFHTSPNIVPIINTLKDVMDYDFYILKQVGLNILLFVPFGLLVDLLKQYRRNILITSLITSVTDVIWNISGALIGYLICINYQKIKDLFIVPKVATN